MSRLVDSILAADNAYGGHSPAMDLTNGGQNGYMSRVGLTGVDGKSYEEWISNHAYVKKNVIPVVLRYPKFMDFMPEKDKWIATYKSLIELHALAIDGLSSGLTVETDEHAIGGAGEFQEELVDVKRARSSLVFNFKEKSGRSIQKFLDFVIRYGMMDPDTKKPLVTQYFTGEDLTAVGGMYTPDFYTGTVIFIEPDTTHKLVVDAWLCSNMMFKSNGDRNGKRDLRVAGETLDLSIESTSITLNNEAVQDLATKILKSLTIINKVPDTDLVLPTTEVDASVDTHATGYNQYN